MTLHQSAQMVFLLTTGTSDPEQRGGTSGQHSRRIQRYAGLRFSRDERQHQRRQAAEAVVEMCDG